MTDPIDTFARADLLPERLAAWLRDEIVSGHLKPGERLVEHALCRQAGVSRVPLREALRMVAADGLVVLAPHRGATVTPLSITEMAELFGLRIALEGYAAAEAARLRTQVHLDELGNLVDQMRRAVSLEALDAYYALASRFHGGLVKAAGNGMLTQSFEQLRTRLRRYQAAMARIPELPTTSIVEHEGILKAVEDGLPAEAQLRAENHLRGLMRQFQDRYTPAATSED